MIRPLERADLPALLRLCSAHAAHEGAPFADDGQLDRWGRIFFASPQRAECLVVEEAGGLVGYVAWAFELSVWRAAEYVHVDCLYLDPAHRGRGLGRALLRALVVHAGARASHLEWQTPAGNDDAVRFYERLGARGSAKIRFTLRPEEPTVGSYSYGFDVPARP